MQAAGQWGDPVIVMAYRLLKLKAVQWTTLNHSNPGQWGHSNCPVHFKTPGATTKWINNNYVNEGQFLWKRHWDFGLPKPQQSVVHITHM